MSGITNGPHIFPENEKFDRTNWIAFKTTVTIAAEVRGAMGYLDGTILDPNTLTTGPTTTTSTSTLSPQTETPWDSNYPSPGEWKARNAWAKGSLYYNICNPIGLGANIAGTATDLWKSLTSIYDKTSELALLHVEEQLRNLHL